MGIQGMELCAMAVVVLLFIAVLKQFGILEPMSMEGIVRPTTCLSLPFPPRARTQRGREQLARVYRVWRGAGPWSLPHLQAL